MWTGLFIYLRYKEKEKIFCEGNFGIYCDDGLAVVDILLGPDMYRKVEQIRKVFKNIGFDVTIKANFFDTDFLDVTLDIQNESHKLYRKPNAHMFYVNSKSNHPEHVLKYLLVAVNNPLQKVSSSQSIFKETTQHYQEATRASGYDHKLAYSDRHKKGKN